MACTALTKITNTANRRMCVCLCCVLAATQGFYDPKSKLVFRALAVKERRLDDALIAHRLQRALQLRQRLFKDSTTTGKLAAVLLTAVDYCCSRAAPRQAGLLSCRRQQPLSTPLLALCLLEWKLGWGCACQAGWYKSVRGCDITQVWGLLAPVIKGGCAAGGSDGIQKHTSWLIHSC